VCTRTVLDNSETRQISWYCSNSNKGFLCLQFGSLVAISTRLFQLSDLTKYDFSWIHTLANQINQPIKRSKNAAIGKELSFCLYRMNFRYLLHMSTPWTYPYSVYSVSYLKCAPIFLFTMWMLFFHSRINSLLQVHQIYPFHSDLISHKFSFTSQIVIN
jgi:hypothetical protein